MEPRNQEVDEGRRRLRAALASLTAAIALSGCGASGPATLTLISGGSTLPVEGALVFAPGERTVFRSDVHGRVALPAGYRTTGLRIHARNHAPVEPERIAHGDTITLEYDETRVDPIERELVFTRKDSLRGTWGQYRANNDLLTYDLDIAIDPTQKFVRGSNAIRFRMVEDGQRIQLDLFDNMSVDSILFEGRRLAFTREHHAVFVDFADTLRQGETHGIVFHWSGHPAEQGRFGGMVFREDSLGNPWVFTANQGIGASLWWPNKDQQPDEVDSMTIAVTVPSGLTDVSNGRFLGAAERGDGTTTYRWKVHYPINNYSVSVNIARYEHFADTLDDVTLDFYALPYHLDAARRQFAQAKPMLECFERYFGDYPFPRDGYKLIEVAYSGMEHQSAVTYGNRFENGYLGRDWTGVGVSPRFDFIIIHESGHEWFGNSVTANDVSDAWIQEGWDTYAEAVYVECMFGAEDALKYVNGYKTKVRNEQSIIGPPGVNYWPTQDQYFKGALFLHTLRSVVDDDAAWWSLLKEYAGHFRYRNLWTVDVINFFNERLERNLRPVFEQYLYHAAIPVLELEFEGDTVRYRWRADVEDFDMPVKVRAGGSVRTLHPTTAWQVEPLDGVSPADWQPSTELFYIDVARR